MHSVHLGFHGTWAISNLHQSAQNPKTQLWWWMISGRKMCSLADAVSEISDASQSTEKRLRFWRQVLKFESILKGKYLRALQVYIYINISKHRYCSKRPWGASKKIQGWSPYILDKDVKLNWAKWCRNIEFPIWINARHLKGFPYPKCLARSSPQFMELKIFEESSRVKTNINHSYHQSLAISLRIGNPTAQHLVHSYLWQSQSFNSPSQITLTFAH